MPDSGASFSCRRTTCNVVDCLWVPKAVSDVRSRALALKLSQVSGACVSCLIVPCRHSVAYKEVTFYEPVRYPRLLGYFRVTSYLENLSKSEFKEC